MIKKLNPVAAAGTAASNIGSGTVSNDEFAYLDGVSAPIQGQIDDLLGAISSGLNAAAMGDGSVDNNEFQTLSLNKAVTSFTPTGSWNNCTYTGFYSVSNRVMRVDWRGAMSNAPSNANLTLDLPTDVAWAIDTAKIVASTNGSQWVHGAGILLDSGTAQYQLFCLAVNSTTSIKLFYTTNGSTTVGQLSKTAPITIANGDTFHFWATFPVTVS